MGSINGGTYSVAETWKIRTKYDSVVRDPGYGRSTEPEGYCLWGTVGQECLAFLMAFTLKGQLLKCESKSVVNESAEENACFHISLKRPAVCLLFHF